MIKVTDIEIGFEFNHAGIPAVIKWVDKDKLFARFQAKDKSEMGTIAISALIKMLNHKH